MPIEHRETRNPLLPKEPIALDTGQLRAFAELLPMAAVAVDGGRVFLNTAALELTGYEPDELGTLDELLNRVFPDARPQTDDFRIWLERSVFSPPKTFWLTKKNGQHCNVEISVKAGEIWLLRDVTEVQRLMRLREQTQAHAGMGSWEVDCRTQAVYWSPEVYHLAQADPCAHQPSPGLPCLPFLAEPSRILLQDATKKATDSGTPFDLELDMTTQNGNALIVRCRCQVETTPAGEPVRLVGWCQDITKQREDQKARELLESQVRRVQKLESLSVLAGGIAHDFNNLLTTILGYASIARMELPNDSHLQEYLSEVEHASRRAAGLTQQMLAYSGAGRFLFHPLAIDELVRDMLPLLTAAVGKQARLILDFPSELPTLQGDAAQIRQVLMNLVCNAAEAMDKPDGLITIRADRTFLQESHLTSPFPTSDPSPGWFVGLEVRDNGAGMNREILARIFDPFYSTKFTGRGLGMAAVLGIVKGHKGLIHVDSEPGKGTTVGVLFPVETGA